MDFATAFFEDLAAFEGDELGEVFFAFAELLAEAADKFAANGAGDIAPGGEGGDAGGDFGFDSAGESMRRVARRLPCRETYGVGLIRGADRAGE